MYGIGSMWGGGGGMPGNIWPLPGAGLRVGGPVEEEGLAGWPGAAAVLGTDSPLVVGLALPMDLLGSGAPPAEAALLRASC